MSDRDRSSGSFGRWLSQPEAIIALAAVLFSLCAVVIALFEASVVRQEARASVWPHVEVSPSLRTDRVLVRVRNTGVGPALIRTAAVTYKGETQADWEHLFRSVYGVGVRRPAYESLIGGRVLSPDSSFETILRLSAETEDVPSESAERLQREIRTGNVDVELCYCSVYDQCWTTTLQGLLARSQGRGTPPTEVAVEDCDGMETSGI